jgi:ubiquinone/menaquinone biosynthesis C-methylase UbiE
MPAHDKMTDPDHLRTSQYATDGHLQKRMTLHHRFSTNPRSWIDWLFDQIEFPPMPAVLEAGCGTGILWSENRHRLPDGLDLTLTDISEGMLATTMSHLGDLATVSQIVDIQQLPFPDATFDVAIANHMLYHVPDIPLAISQLARVLKPGGLLIASTNGEQHMVETHDLIETIQGQRPKRTIATRFSLENGAAQLDPWFPRVERREFPDRIEATEVEPVIAYLESTAEEDDLTEDQLEMARGIVADAIARDGAFRIRKSAGVFIAHK